MGAGFGYRGLCRWYEFLVSMRGIDCTVYLLKVGLTSTSSSSFLRVGCLEVWYRRLDIFRSLLSV